MSNPDSGQMTTIMGSISADEKAIGLASFDAIIARTPASVGFLSQRTGIDSFAIAKAIAHLMELGLLVCDHAGNVVGSWGLTLVPSRHRLRMFDNDYYTWCAEDAVGIPAALDADAMVTSSCFQCGQEVVIEIEQGEVIQASPKNTHLWLAEAEIGRSVIGCT